MIISLFASISDSYLLLWHISSISKFVCLSKPMVYASGALFLFAGKPYASCFPSPGSLTFRYTDTQCSKTLWLPLPWKLHQHKTNKLHDSKVIVNSLHIHCTFEKMLILNGNPLTILVKHKNVRTKAKISLYIIKHICLLSLYLPPFFISVILLILTFQL